MSEELIRCAFCQSDEEIAPHSLGNGTLIPLCNQCAATSAAAVEESRKIHDEETEWNRSLWLGTIKQASLLSTWGSVLAGIGAGKTFGWGYGPLVCGAGFFVTSLAIRLKAG